MYRVSGAYREAMKGKVQKFRLSGTIKTKNGIYDFQETDILKGSFRMGNQCCGNEEIQIGSVYTAELNMTLVKEVERYSLENAEVTPVFKQKLKDGSWEEIPLGIFDIAEANWTRSGIQLTAYDRMGKFEKNFASTVTNGTPYELLSLACMECGAGLGMTEEEVKNLPNGAETLGIYPDNDIETYRDLIAYTVQVLAGFATINRKGELVVVNYTDVVSDTMDTEHRWNNCSFSDFVTKYTGLSIVNIKDQSTKYYNLNPDDGLTMNIGSNPLLQYGVEETNERIAGEILKALKKVNYVPFAADMIGNPAYDLGDVFRFPGGYGDGEKLFCMTKFSFDYNAKYSMQGAGKNPRLASAKSKTDKNLSGIIGNISSKDIIFYAFVNAYDYHIEKQKECIITVDFASKEGGTAEFKASVLLSTKSDFDSTETQVKVFYKINNNEITTYCPQETYINGAHTLFLYYPVAEIEENKRNRIEVFLETSGGAADIRQGQILANISGQGMAAEKGNWDGNIEAEEIISAEIPGFGATISAEAYTRLLPYQKNEIQDVISAEIPGMELDFTEQINLNTIYVQDIMSAETKDLCSYDMLRVKTEYQKFALRTEYMFETTEVTTDSGRMAQVEVITEKMKTITAMTWAEMEAGNETQGFLIKEGEIIYTFADGKMTELKERTLESSLFLQYGCKKADVILTQIQKMKNPKIYEWQPEADKPIPEINIKMNGTPENQTVRQSFRLDRAEIKGIEKMSAVYEGNPTVTLSEDGIHNKAFLENAWKEVEGEEGMSIASVELITEEQWMKLIENTTELHIKVLLVEKSSLEKIVVSYKN